MAERSIAIMEINNNAKCCRGVNDKEEYGYDPFHFLLFLK
jgi:hypothetical protein